MLTAGWQKLRLLFGLAEKHRKHTFLAKHSHITKYSAKCVAKSVNHLSWKHVKCRSQQLLIEPGQYIGDCKSARADLIIRKKTVAYVVCANATRCSIGSDSMGLYLRLAENKKTTSAPETNVIKQFKKGNGSPYSITERRVPELIPVLGRWRES